MTSVHVDFDVTGTPVGSMYIYATARDWARFARLYLDDGSINGRQILPAGWVAYCATPTLNTDYGAGFWTNRLGHGDAVDRIAAGLPEDSFYASGNFGQRVLIEPSRKLVIVRFGQAHGPGQDIRGLLHLSAAIARSMAVSESDSKTK
jgi:CubicO group peptidase (beta-lactamase class C family)